MSEYAIGVFVISSLVGLLSHLSYKGRGDPSKIALSLVMLYVVVSPVAAMVEELQKFGACVLVEENTVTVKKSELHAPSGMLSGHNDHRIVMSLSLLLTLFGGVADEAEAVRKSYPSFFDEIKNLGITLKKE